MMMQRFLPPILGLALIFAPVVGRAEDSSDMRRIVRATEAEAAVAPAPAIDTPAQRPVRLSGQLRFDSEGSAGVRALIAKQAEALGVPAPLADAVARIESRYNPRALHAGNYGLMQIRLQTARGEGYSGSGQGLLDAETNAHYGVKHLARAYRLAGGDTCGAIMRYQNGLRSTRMSGANRAYCAKAKAIMGSSRFAAAS